MMKQGNIRQIARQRIEILFVQAQKVAQSNPKLAAEYVGSARRIAMAARIRLPHSKFHTLSEYETHSELNR
ncbi:MAG: hypothetical protein NWE92_08030 [Candidatus Bathyarchaeota archaeon]|nr:hypothetical protein [Candidatus Bathyarchaeota archaeon]